MLSLGAIEKANHLRGIIALAARLLVTPTEKTLNEFLAAAKKSPEKSFPYAWEIIQFGKQGREDVKAVIDSSLGEELRSFVRNALEKEALVAEAYLLDFAAVDVRDGLLLDAIYRTYTELWGRRFGGEPPFDWAAVVFLLADAEHEEPAFDPVTVSAWKRALDEHENTTNALGGLGGVVPKNYSNEPAIFTFWLAVQKERFKKLLEDKSMEGQKKELVEEALNLMKNVPSKKEAAERVRDRKYGGSMPWGYFGEYAIPIRMAFEKAAQQ